MNALSITCKGLAWGIITALTRTLAETIRATQHFLDALGHKTNMVERCARIEGALTNSAAVHNRGWVSSETTTHPFGISDYSVHTDKRGLQTVAFSIPSSEAVTSTRYVFASPEEPDPAIIETSTFFRNGRSISTRYWNGQWLRETRFAQYAADGTRSDFSVSEASDLNGSVTNAISYSDFLGCGMVQTTPLETTTNIYDGASSRVLCTVSSAAPAVTNLYDDMGQVVGATSAGVTTLSIEAYETLFNEVWRVRSRFQIAGGTTNGLGVSRSQLTGLSNSLRRREVTTDASGATTETTASFDPQSGILVETPTTDAHTPVVRKKRHGRDVEIHDATGLYYLKHDPFGRQYMRRFDNGAFSGGYPLDAVIFNDCGDRVLSAVCEFNSSTFLVKSFAYDVFGNLVATEDELGGTVISDHDALGNLVSQAGTAAYPVRYGYDTMGRMKTLGTRRSGEDWDETQWSRDFATGLVTAKTYEDDSSVSYTYTADGKPLRTTWARGAWKGNAYDALGRLSAASSSDGGDVGLGYDAFNRISSASNAVAAYAYANSALGSATNETMMVDGKVCMLTRRLGDRHRLAGLALSPLPLGEGQGEGAAPYSVAYAYDSEGRLAVVANLVFSAAYAYSDRGLDVGYTLTLTNGVSLKRALGRNGYRHELIRRVDNTVSTGHTNTLVYAYDDAGRRTSRNTDTFGYNPRSEVTSAAIATNVYSYAYDHIGSHTTSTVNSATTTYVANALNQYTAILCAPAPLREPSYDLDGNMLTNGVWSYAWDAANQLTAVYSNSICIVSNAYDHASRRVLKVSHGGAETRRFVYDGWLPVAEIVATSTATTTNLFVWGKDLSGTPQGAGGVGGLLAVSIDGSFYFPFYDNNGNIIAYVDEQGSVVAEYTYDCFGGSIAKTGPMADAFVLRFSTKYHDVETGLYYYGYRFYSPALHRWQNRDPIQEDGGPNLYGFCGNAPLGFYDILGTDWLDNTANFSAGVGDSLSFGLTRLARRGINRLFFEDNWNDLNVDPSSGAYIAGETTEVVVEIAVTAGGASLRHVAKRTSRVAIEGGARKTFRRAIGKVNAGGYVHHINPIRSGRFPLPFKSSAQGHWNMTWIGSSPEHLAAHSYLRRLDALEDVRTMTLGIRQAGNELALFLEKENPCWDSIDIRMSIIEEAYSDQSVVSGAGVASAFFFIIQ